MNRQDFPILGETVYGKPLVYLDNAATTQKPQQVLDAITYAYSHWNSNIHRGVHHLSQVATQKHEEARQIVADFIGAKSSCEIIFTKGTTDSINTLAFSFGEACVHEGDEIIVSGLEHHANIVPWQMLCERKKAVLRVIPLLDSCELNIEAFKGLFSEKTKLVAVAHVSNVLGIVNSIDEIVQIAHAHGVPVMVDAAQSAPHLKIDVQKIGCDFLVFSGHKMYAPTGIGVLWGKEEWLNQLPPTEGGGEMIDHVRWTSTTYNVLPFKFEAGTPNYVGSHALGEAIHYMQTIGTEAIEQHETELTQYCEELLSAIPEVHVYAAGIRKAGAISFNVYNGDKIVHPFDVGTLLDRQGVAVRTGHHCAEPLIDWLGVPGTVRVSMALYTDKEDIDAFVKALRRTIMMLC